MTLGNARWPVNRSTVKELKTVCLGHSQGNFFCNLAYQVIRKDLASSAYALPNNNVLEVVSIATPASYTADGRFQYVKYCKDVINAVPFALNYNYQNPADIVPCVLFPTGGFLSDLQAFASLLLTPIGKGQGWNQHDMDAVYLAPGSDLLNHVMTLIANTLPDPGCNGDERHYMV